jgi:hypothetical protein
MRSCPKRRTLAVILQTALGNFEDGRLLTAVRLPGRIYNSTGRKEGVGLLVGNGIFGDRRVDTAFEELLSDTPQ